MLTIVPTLRSVRGRISEPAAPSATKRFPFEIGGNRLLAWSSLKVSSVASPRFPLVIDTGFTGFMTLRWEYVQQILGIGQIEQLLTEKRDLRFKFNDYGGYLNTRYEVLVAGSEQSKQALKLAPTTKIQIYFPKNMIETSRFGIDRKSNLAWQIERRPKVPLLGMLALKSSKLKLLISGSTFALCRWPWVTL